MTPSAAGDEKIYCPYCQTDSDFYFPFYSRTYYHCPSCDLIFVRRKEDIKTVIAYYQNLYFDDHTEDQMSGQRTNIYRHILDVLEDYKKPGSLLDLGCGCGFFLKEARERGWQVSGVDPSEKSIAYAKSQIGDAVVCGTLDDIPTDRRFDAITPRAIRRCLGDMGFADIRVSNAHLTGGNFCTAGRTFSKLAKKILRSLTWGFFKSLEKLSGGRWLWGPSLQVIARKGTGGRRP